MFRSRSQNNGIVLPRIQLTAAPRMPVTDPILGFDDVARAALEVNRSSYNPLPAGSTQEFAAFFSRKNYGYLYTTAKKMAKNNPDSGELFEAMSWAYSVVQPRGDEMDERRKHFTSTVTQSYVNEMNKHVLERVVPDIKAANMQWDHLAKYRHGPVDMQAEDDGNIDTRTRLHSAQVDMTYYLP